MTAPAPPGAAGALSREQANALSFPEIPVPDDLTLASLYQAEKRGAPKTYSVGEFRPNDFTGRPLSALEDQAVRATKIRYGPQISQMQMDLQTEIRRNDDMKAAIDADYQIALDAAKQQAIEADERARGLRAREGVGDSGFLRGDLLRNAQASVREVALLGLERARKMAQIEGTKNDLLSQYDRRIQETTGLQGEAAQALLADLVTENERQKMAERQQGFAEFQGRAGLGLQQAGQEEAGRQFNVQFPLQEASTRSNILGALEAAKRARGMLPIDVAQAQQQYRLGNEQLFQLSDIYPQRRAQEEEATKQARLGTSAANEQLFQLTNMYPLRRQLEEQGLAQAKLGTSRANEELFQLTNTYPERRMQLEQAVEQAKQANRLAALQGDVAASPDYGLGAQARQELTRAQRQSELLAEQANEARAQAGYTAARTGEVGAQGNEDAAMRTVIEALDAGMDPNQVYRDALAHNMSPSSLDRIFAGRGYPLPGGKRETPRLGRREALVDLANRLLEAKNEGYTSQDAYNLYLPEIQKAYGDAITAEDLQNAIAFQFQDPRFGWRAPSGANPYLVPGAQP